MAWGLVHFEVLKLYYCEGSPAYGKTWIGLTQDEITEKLDAE